MKTKLLQYLNENKDGLSVAKQAMEDLLGDNITKLVEEALGEQNTSKLIESCNKTYQALDFLLYTRVDMEYQKELYSQEQIDYIDKLIIRMTKSTADFISTLDQNFRSKIADEITKGAIRMQNKIAEVEMLIDSVQ